MQLDRDSQLNGISENPFIQGALDQKIMGLKVSTIGLSVMALLVYNKRKKIFGNL